MIWRQVRESAHSFAQSWWAVVLIGLLVSGIVYQHWQYTHPSRPQLVKVGDRVSPVTLETLGKQEIQIKWGADARPTIVYAFTPICGWCKRNLEAMRTVAAHASGYHFIAVSLTANGVSDYVKANDLKVPVYIAGKDAAKQLGLSGTPSTIVITPNGKVKEFWRGVYWGKVGEEVSRVFNVKLPEVKAD
jgi:protein-disulfide isomerase-like protein with CxxC motif